MEKSHIEHRHSSPANVLIEFYQNKSKAGIDHYSKRCLCCIWRAKRFSWWFTGLMHCFSENSDVGKKLQKTKLDLRVNFKVASLSVAQNFVGLPLDFGNAVAN